MIPAVPFFGKQKTQQILLSLKQGYKDSNLEMTESESVALPFGDSPKNLNVLDTNDIIRHDFKKSKYFLKKFKKFLLNKIDSKI